MVITRFKAENENRVQFFIRGNGRHISPMNSHYTCLETKLHWLPGCIMCMDTMLECWNAVCLADVCENNIGDWSVEVSRIMCLISSG